jgi:hypothetical protein
MLTVPHKDQGNVSLEARLTWIKQAMSIPENSEKIDKVLKTLVKLENPESNFSLIEDCGTARVLTLQQYWKAIRRSELFPSEISNGFWMKGPSLVSVELADIGEPVPNWATHVAWYDYL